MEWVPAHRWPGGETVLVPTEIAACSVGDFTPGYRPFTTPITNGLGAGPTLDFAIGHGICELLQRDGNGTGFRAMDRGIVLDLADGPADPRTRALLDRLEAHGHRGAAEVRLRRVRRGERVLRGRRAGRRPRRSRSW